MATNIAHLDYIAGNTIIQFTDTDPALLSIDAIVEEQDTNMVLGKAMIIKETIDSFPALINKMQQQIPEKPGTIIMKKSRPLRIIAIVYDVDHKPMCRREWIVKAVDNILKQCNEYSIKTLAMPLLGTEYGKMTTQTTINLLQACLNKHRYTCPEKILLYDVD